MKRGAGPWLYVTADDSRGVLLLRGDGARPVVAALGLDARYSERGRGWVVDLAHLADVVAFCEHRHALCVVSTRKAGAA